jgi:hypothetical protein
VTDLPLSIILVGKVEHNRSALKNALGTICDSRDAAIGVDLQEPPMIKVSSAKAFLAKAL